MEKFRSEPTPSFRFLEASTLSQSEADPHAAHDPDRARHSGAHERPILVGNAEAMDVCAGLAELIGQHAGFSSRELKGLLDVCGGHHFDLFRGQNAAARATPSAPVTTSFSSRPTGAICTACVTVPELTVPRHRAPG